MARKAELKMKKVYMILLLLSVVLVASCSSQQPQTNDQLGVQPIPATAKLDARIEQIDFPLDAFSLSVQDMDKIEEANSVKMQACLAEAGQVIDLSPYNRHRTFTGERPYGAWSVANAQVNGYEMPAGFSGVAPLNLASQGAEFNKSWDSCLGKSLVSNKVSVSNGPTTKLQRQAANLAAQDKNFQKIVDEWDTCLGQQGLKKSDNSIWQPDVSSAHGNKEALIRIAVKDTTCKESVSMVQRLADIESSYQAALIKQNESALNAYRKDLDSMLSDASQVIQSLGKK